MPNPKRREYFELLGTVGLIAVAAMLIVPLCVGCSAPTKEAKEMAAPSKYKITLEWEAVTREVPELRTHTDGSFDIHISGIDAKGRMNSFTMTRDGLPTEGKESAPLPAEAQPEKESKP